MKQPICDNCNQPLMMERGSCGFVHVGTGKYECESAIGQSTNKTHELKTDPEVFDAVERGEKTFEIRFDDRNFKVGDTLILKRTVYSGEAMKGGTPLLYSGKELSVVVTHKLAGRYGLQDGWCILSFKPLQIALPNQDEIVEKWFAGDSIFIRSAATSAIQEATASETKRADEEQEKFRSLVQDLIKDLDKAGVSFGNVNDQQGVDIRVKWLIEERDSLREKAEAFDELDKNGELQHIYEEGRPNETVPCLRLDYMKFDFADLTLLAAINQAKGVRG